MHQNITHNNTKSSKYTSYVQFRLRLHWEYKLNVATFLIGLTLVFLYPGSEKFMYYGEFSHTFYKYLCQ